MALALLVSFAACSPLRALDTGTFVVVGQIVYFPNQAASTDPDQEYVSVNFNTAGQMRFSWAMINGQTKRTGGSTLGQTGAAFPMVVNGQTFSIYALTTFNTQGSLWYKETSWTNIGPHASNDVQAFQESYIAWVDSMRGEGYPVNISLGAFLAFLRGIQTIDPEELEGMGGTPGPPGGNPNGTANGSVTLGNGGTTTTAVNGTTTVTTNNDVTYTYNYNYDNSVTNNNTTDPIDLSPVVDAIEDGTAATVANGQKIDETNDKLDYLTGHVIDGQQAIADAINGLETGGGGGTAGPVVGVEVGEGPDVGAVVGDGAGQGVDAAGDKFGSVTGVMAISGQANHAVTVGVPWIDGGTQSFTINSLPDSGSALDSFRLILRTFLGVLIALAFIFMTVQAFRFY